MSAFEIAELRAMIGDRLLNIYRFWLTLTMATFAVAYYAGSQLDGFSIGALVAFHGLMSMLMRGLIGTAVRQTAALAQDADTLEKSGSGAAISSVKMIQFPANVLKGSSTILGVTFIALVAYLLRMTL